MTQGPQRRASKAGNREQSFEFEQCKQKTILTTMGGLPTRGEDLKCFPGVRRGRGGHHSHHSIESIVFKGYGKSFVQTRQRTCHANKQEKKSPVFYRRCNQPGIPFANAKPLRRLHQMLAGRLPCAARRCPEQQHALELKPQGILSEPAILVLDKVYPLTKKYWH